MRFQLLNFIALHARYSIYLFGVGIIFERKRSGNTRQVQFFSTLDGSVLLSLKVMPLSFMAFLLRQIKHFKMPLHVT